MNKKVVNFIFGQINQIRKGRLSVLFRKLRTILLILLALPAVFLIRILRPFIIIRFGQIMSSRIGHLAISTELYLCERQVGKHNPRNFDIFYYEEQISNYQLKKMWDRRLHIFRFAKWLDRANRLIPGAQRHVIVMTASRDINGFLERTSAHLSFATEEEQFGRDALRKLGIQDGNPFVCFSARDYTYLDKTLSGNDWNYHNYRNSDIYSYIPAAEELVRRGYFTIRMGFVVKDKLNVTNPRIIDYALNNRTDFLDIYLGAKCRFFICDSGGIYAVAEACRRPIARVNFIPLRDVPTWSRSQLFIPKKLWLRKEQRFLSFHEIFDSDIGGFHKTEQYDQLDIEVIKNTPEEITALAVEMDERLKGKWKKSKEDEQLQRRFWTLFKPKELNRVFLSRIGTEFLRQNRNLLE